MTTSATAPANILQLDNELNQAVLAGKILEAFEQYYADGIVMQENTDAPTKGKAANRQREIDFLNSVEQFHGAKLLGSAVNGNRSYSEWELDVTFKGASRVKLTQIAVREWKDGQVVFERFYYAKG